MNGVGQLNWGAPRNGGSEGGQPYSSSGCNWCVGCLNPMSLLSVFPASMSDASKLSSGLCWDQNNLLVGAILVVIGRDPFMDFVCEQDGGKELSIQFVISNKGNHNWEYWMLQWSSAECRPLKYMIFVTTCGVSLHLWSHETQLRRRNHITHIPPFFVIDFNWYTRTLDRHSPLFSSWL